MRNHVKTKILIVMLVLSLFPVFVQFVYGASITQDGTSYWLENENIKFKVTNTLQIERIKEITLNRDVGYFYFYFQYRQSWDSPVTEFYFYDIGVWNLQPSSSPASTVTLTCTKTYTDGNDIMHSFKMIISLTDGDHVAKITFEDVASTLLYQVGLFMESCFFPQGYENQASGGNLNVGGNTAYSVPVPYDNAMYVYTHHGNITKDYYGEITILATYQNIDAYLCSYSSDASFGFYGHYVDLRKMRFRTLDYSAERQFMWFDLNSRTQWRNLHTLEFYFGVWNVGSASECQSAYNSLSQVESLEPQPSRRFMFNVRTDLNAYLYEYNDKFPTILENILNRTHPFTNQSIQYVNATLVPSGSVSYTFWKWRNHPNYWNNVTQDTQEDFVQKSVNMAREKGVRLYVEVDVLDAIWTVLHPWDCAIGVDGQPYKTFCTACNGTGEVEGHTCRSCGGTGEAGYWIKMKWLITNGEAYHDNFVAMITELCENYNFYALVMSESFYKYADYSDETKSLWMNDTGHDDWIRDKYGNIDIYNEELGKWKTEKLGQLWDEIKNIANQYNKKFYVMVEPNFEYPTYQAWEFGQWYPEAIKHCDGLWVWAYYGYFHVSAKRIQNLLLVLKPLAEQYPLKDIMISIGLWDSPAITPDELNEGLNILQGSDFIGWGWGVEVTPSKLMTSEHWDVLWGYPVPSEEFWFPVMLAIGMFGLVGLIVLPVITVKRLREKNYMFLVETFMYTLICSACVIAWLWG